MKAPFSGRHGAIWNMPIGPTLAGVWTEAIGFGNGTNIMCTMLPCPTTTERAACLFSMLEGPRSHSDHFGCDRCETCAVGGWISLHTAPFPHQAQDGPPIKALPSAA